MLERRERPARRALAGGRARARAGARAPGATPMSRREALRASDALKTALLRAVSHELRTPLTAIKAAVGALRGDQVQLGEEAVRELLEDVSIETRPPRPPRLRPARRLAPAGRHGVDRARLVRGRRPRARRGGGGALARAPDTRIEIETEDGPAARALRRVADRARARQPDRERRQVLAARRARRAARPQAPTTTSRSRSSTTARASRSTSASACSSRSTAGAAAAPAAPVWGSRSRAASSRPTQGRSRSTMLPVAARACASCCRA